MTSVLDPQQLLDAVRDHKNEELGENSLAAIQGLVKEHTDLVNIRDELEDAVKMVKERIRTIEQGRLPDLMLSLGIESFSTDDGFVITVQPIVSGAIPKKNLPEAIAWLRDHGAGDIVRQDLGVSFSAGDEAAGELAKELHERGFPVNSAETVHASTLKSWARQQLAAAKELPLDLLGLYHGRQAKFSIKKG